MRFAVRHFPDRKKPCLVFEKGNHGIVVATFRNEEMAKLYDHFMGNIGIVDNLKTLEEEVEEAISATK